MHSPEGPPWSRAETGTEVCCPRPFCCLFGHRRPGSALGIDVSRGGVNWTIDAICFETPHACPPCCPLTDVSRDRTADGKQTREKRGKVSNGAVPRSVYEEQSTQERTGDFKPFMHVWYSSTAHFISASPQNNNTSRLKLGALKKKKIPIF